jgi:hypothetical protein
MTDTQRNALKIVIEAVVNGASNGYTVKVDDIVTVIEGIIEKETQFVPGLYPSITAPNKPYPYLDQMISYNSTSTADVNSNDIQMICEKNPIKPNEWEDNEF